MVSQPRVITKIIDGVECEPYEDLTVDVPESYVGAVMEKLGPRRGELVDMQMHDGGVTRLRYRIPARGLFGYRTEFMTDTRGTGIMSHIFLEYARTVGELTRRSRGVIVAMNTGMSTHYAIESIQERAVLFIGPQVEVYEGMIVGENSREKDMVVNITKLKHLTNMRTSSADVGALTLTPPLTMSLENALEFIEDDEFVELTPESIRLRKKFLKARDRKD
jgi:GTP-binding protein